MEAVGRPVKWLRPGLQLLPGLSDGDELLSSFRITSQEQLTPLVDTGWVPRPERSIPDGLFHSLPTKKKALHYFTHFTDEKTEAQRGDLAHPELESW